MRRILAVSLVLLCVGVVFAVQQFTDRSPAQAGVADAKASGCCPMAAAAKTEAAEGQCPVAAKACDLRPADCPKEACCQECPLKDDCPKAGEPGCCAECPLNKGECPQAKACEVRPAGCPKAAEAAPVKASACPSQAPEAQMGCGAVCPSAK